MSSYPDASSTYVIAAMQELSRLRGRPTLLSINAPFDHEATEVFYACLRRMGKQDALDLVLCSHGGDPGYARRLGVLLRFFTRQLSIFVLDAASSAASLLCLAADELLMSPLSSLSPIDPQVLSALPISHRDLSPDGRRGDGRQGGPHSISSEEARLFTEMAHEWFGVGQSAEERLALVQLVCQRIFPTTLTTFFRADHEMRAAASELLRFHQEDEEVRRCVCDRLIGGFFSHSHAICREEARELGLRVHDLAAEEEECLWHLHCWSRNELGRTCSDPENSAQFVCIQAVLAGPGFISHYVVPVSSHTREEREGLPPSRLPGWRVLPTQS